MDQDGESPSPPFLQILTDADTTLRLAQGDIIVDFSSKLLPIYRPTEIGLIVASNTCDLEQPSTLAYLVVAPIFDLAQWIERAIGERLQKASQGATVPEYDNVLEFITGKLDSLTTYKDKTLFFMPPHPVFKMTAAIASIEQVLSLPMSEFEGLAKCRQASMKPPWREKLGYKLGYLFSRVATWSPDRPTLKGWLGTTYGGVIRTSLRSAGGGTS